MRPLLLAGMSAVILAGCMRYAEPQTLVKTVVVGPETAACQGLVPQTCLIVDGQFFYDQIDGFTHEPGVTRRIEIERRTICAEGTETACPQDAGRYRYTLLRVIS